MPPTATRIDRVDAPTLATLRPRLSALLIDAVEHGASVGFLAPLDARTADAYWRRVSAAVADQTRVVLVASDDAGEVAGTVQLDVDTMPNQPHRATVSKLLVHSSARRRGVGTALMEALEREARTAGRWLLTLDTATPDAARLYERLGYRRAGEIPDYALSTEGIAAPTAYYWKRL